MGSLTDLEKAGDVIRSAWETDHSSLLKKVNLGRSQKGNRTTTSYGTAATSEARTFPGKRSWSPSKENMDTRHQISHVPSLEHDASPSQVLQRWDDFTSELVS